MLRKKLFSCGAVAEVIEAAVGEIVEAAYIGDPAFVPDNDDLGAALDGGAVFAAGGGGPASPSLGKDDFADATVVADAIADVSYDARHLGFFCREHALMGKEDLEKDHPKEASANKTAENRENKNERSEEATVAIEQIAGCSEPAEKSGDSEAVDGGDSVRAAVGVGVRGMSQAEMTDVKVREAAGEGENAENETDDEADEIDGFHGYALLAFALVCGFASFLRAG